MKKICIFSNLPQRDRATDERIAYFLRREGFEVRVAPFLPDNRNHIMFWQPHIIILPEARCEYTISLAKKFREWGGIAIARRTEGGAAWDAWKVMGQDEKNTVIGAWPYDLDLEIVWSHDFKKLMGKYGYLPANRIYAAGGFPFDLYFVNKKPPKPKGRKNLMFASGWGHADRTPGYNVPEAPPGSSIHKDAYDRNVKGRKEWINMLKKVCGELKGDGWDFYLRIKTGEYMKPYQEELKDTGIKLTTPCPAIVVLQHMDLLVHAGSTLGIEAHLYNIPALSYYGSLNHTPGYDRPHVSPDFENVDELLEAIKNLELNKSNADLDAIKKLEHDFYGKIDGNACLRAAKRITKLFKKKKQILNIPSIWPEETKEFDTPGVLKQIEQWVCECCKKSSFTPPGNDMVKCPWCGISLARKPLLTQVRNLGQPEQGYKSK